MSVARGKTAKPFVVKTPYPDPNETARKLGMSKNEVARVERLVTAATRPKSSSPPLLAYLRQLVRRVKQGKTVLFVYPGLPLYAFVPVSDLRMIEQVERMRNPPRRERRTVSMTIEELAQCLGEMLPRRKTVSKRPAGKASSGSPVIRKAARPEPGRGARTKSDMERDQARGPSGAAPVGASHRRRRPDPAVSLSRTKAGTPGRPSRKRKAAATRGHGPHA